MLTTEGNRHSGRLLTLLTVGLISAFLILAMGSLVSAETELAALAVTKSITDGTAYPGGTIEYTISIEASGSGFAQVNLTDTIPVSLTYVANSISASDGVSVGVSGGMITASYPALVSGDSIDISFDAMVDAAAPLGTEITNIVYVEGRDFGATEILSDSVSVTVMEQVDPVDLYVFKTVDGGDFLPGGTIEYSIVVSSTASTPRDFTFTDTLPAGLTYVPNSLTGPEGFSISESGGVISSGVYALNPGQSLEATFETMIDASVPVSTVITNTVMMEDFDNNLVLSDIATAIVVTRPSTYYVQMPIFFKALPGPSINGITPPSGSENVWTVSWSDIHSSNADVTGYQLEEATDANFSENVVVTDLGKVVSTIVTKDLSTTVTYYYRVRAKTNGDTLKYSEWSGTTSVDSVFYYEENFSDTSNPTNWRIVRQDTDTVSQTVRIIDPGYLDLRMESRYDYMIASDLTKLPDKPYTLVARMRLEDADPRHAGGIILGGDYDGVSECPVANYSTCFNVYYRFMFIAGNLNNQIEVRIKRIEEHDVGGDNSGSGTDLGSYNLTLGGSQDDWIEWTIQVKENNDMTLLINGTEVGTVNDDRNIDKDAFGFWSSTSDTSYSNTQIDWVKITSD